MHPDERYGGDDFWPLWETNKKILFGRCLRLMNGNVSEAEDALSTAMLKAWERIAHSGERIHNFRGWALRVTENVCLDRLRKERRLVYLDRVPDVPAGDEVGPERVFVESAEGGLFREAVLREMFESVCSLPDRLRNVALPRFFLSEPYHHIAERLHITEETARKRVQEARSVLRTLYGDAAGDWLSSSRDGGGESDPPVMAEIRKELSSIIETAEPEIQYDCRTAWIVNVRPISGTDKEALMFLSLTPGWHGKKLVAYSAYASKHPGGWKRHLELSQMLCALGVWDLSEHFLLRVIERRPGSFPARILLGNMLLESGREEEAARLFEDAGSLARQDSSKHYLAGMVALSRAELRDAAGSFEKASRLEPLNAVFGHGKGICLFRSGDYGEALRFFRTMLAARPKDIVSLAYCCEASIRLRRPVEAARYADSILMHNPGDFFALKRKSALTCPGQGSWKMDQRRFECLRLSLERAARMARDPENTKFTRRVVHTSRG